MSKCDCKGVTSKYIIFRFRYVEYNIHSGALHLFTVQECLFFLLLDNARQQSCWDIWLQHHQSKDGLQGAVSASRQATFIVKYQALSIVFSYLNFHCLSSANQIEVHCSRQPQFAMPAMSQPQRWPCSQTGMPYSARNWTIFSLWNHKRAPTLLCSVKLQLDINVTAISHIKYLPPHHVCVPRHAMCIKGVI